MNNIHHAVTFDFPIKSIVQGNDKNYLLIETYDPNTQTQTFLLLNLEKLEIIQAISFGSDYRGLVVKSYNTERLLFIQYSDQNNPDLTNIFTFSWSGGEPLMSLMNTRIIKSGLEWIKIPHPNFENKEVVFNIHSGEQLSKEPKNEITHDSPSIYATAYPEESEYFQWFVQYFNKFNINPCRQIEYLKTDQKVFISYYEDKNDRLVNTLAVLNKEGMIIDEITLEEELSGIGKDTFFVFRNKAIFVTQKSTLNIYEL